VGLLCGCPGDPVEGQGTAASDGASSTGNDDATVSASASNTITVGSQSATDTTDSGITITSADTGDPTGDPTSATLDDTTSASVTIGDTTITSTDDTSTSLSAGTSTDTGACVEPEEPNETEAAATVLPDIACDASATVDGFADAATTPDWFMFHGAYNAAACGELTTDDALPRVQVTAGGPLTVCAYVSCLGTVTCVSGIAAASPDGRAGCCADSDANLSVNCPNGSDESTDVFVSVDTSASSCSAYTLQLSF
jgi:hypothetical protein